MQICRPRFATWRVYANVKTQECVMNSPPTQLMKCPVHFKIILTMESLYYILIKGIVFAFTCLALGVF